MTSYAPVVDVQMHAATILIVNHLILPMTEADHLPVLSSVMLLRLHDYAQRPVAEQARLSAQLDTVLAMLLPDIPEQSRIVLAGGGRAAVAVLDNPPAALAFAEAALTANQAGLGLCIGIDHGPVEIVHEESGDVLAGDGVVTASVMATFASDAKLLMSQNFRTALANMSPGSEGALVPADNFSDAGLRTYQAFRLDRQAMQQRRRRFIMIAVVSAILLLSISVAFRMTLPDRPRPLAPYIGSTVTNAIDQIKRLTDGQP